MSKQTQQQPECQRKVGSPNFRSMDMELIDEGESKKIRMTVSSETPVLTWIRMNDQWLYAYEILDHSEESIDRSRCKDGLVIQDTHHGDQVGLIRNVVVTERKLGGLVEFCSGERAREIAMDAEKGLRRNASVGYYADPSSYVIEGEKDGYPLVRAKRWTPYEGSFVNVPADTNVGVGRAQDDQNKTARDAGKEPKEMNPKDMAEMFTRAAKFGIEADKVSALIADGKGRAELDAMIVERQAEQITSLRTADPKKPDMPQKREQIPILGGDEKTQTEITRNYSLLNVFRNAAGIQQDARGNKVDIGFEREIDQECRRMRMGSQRGGQFIVPHAVLASRTLSVSGTSSATVATNLLAGEFIDVLRTKNIMDALGIRMMSGIVGNNDIPKMTAGATGYWVSEGVAITGSQSALGQVEATPHTCGVMTDITRRMLMQSTPSAEMFTRNEILERLARTLQIAIFQGTGADGQPSAITNASGINNPSVTAGTPTYAEMLGFPGMIMADNADVDGQKWAISAAVWQKLAATFTDGTAKAERLLDYKTRTLLGFPYFVTQDVGTNAAFFGDWSSVLVSIWGGGIDLNMDTATLSSSGGLRIVGLQDVDVSVRLGEALAYNTAVTN